jgi:hypothetical protein
MPRQNRCDPWGNIVAHPARGTLMGNRGCLHDDAGQIVRTSARAAWITCVPTWPGIRRPLMAPGQYTELFFLDEAIALAAGHRPCGSCRPEALAAFKLAWATAYGLANLPRVAEIDGALRGSVRNHTGTVDDLPDGAMIAADGEPLLRWQGRWLVWSFDGYRPAQAPSAAGAVLTPARVLDVLKAGYLPEVHPSASSARLQFHS